MPALDYVDAVSAPTNLVPELVGRADFSLFKSSTASNGGSHIDKRAIIIICLCFIPIIVITGIVIWALAFYGRDRSCCSCCRGRSQKSKTLGKGKGKVEQAFGEGALMKPLPMMPEPGLVQIGSKHDPLLSRQWSGESGKTIGKAMPLQPHGFL